MRMTHTISAMILMAYTSVSAAPGAGRGTRLRAVVSGQQKAPRDDDTGWDVVPGDGVIRTV
jgi:hypothetical protein